VVVCVQVTLLFELARCTEPERTNRELLLRIYRQFPCCVSGF